MRDLYRIVPYNYETEDEPVFVGGRQMLVKVVPDYEAAADAVGNLWYRASKPARKEQAKEIVDAALEGNSE